MKINYWSKYLAFYIVFLLMHLNLKAQNYASDITVGAEQLNEYLPRLKNKKIALLVNQTSVIGRTHLVDTLKSLDLQIVKIFAPEHGFRGTADAGEKVVSGVDKKTGIPISSMYGAQKKPSAESMKGIDIVLFDIQDVGARFYTYISSLQYMMEACAQFDIPLLILDRPNPNGFYVDGPILDTKNKSFVGMQPIPIVHGMTVAEYAQMLNGEKWLSNQKPCKLLIVPCKNYNHKKLYQVPIPPSPNLRSQVSIYLYPSLCLFEGTIVSVGRGTETPFEVWGAPMFQKNGFSFIPKSTEGAKSPMYENQVCYGENLHHSDEEILKILNSKLNFSFLKKAYSQTPKSTKFFNDFFEKLSGTDALRLQIQENKLDEEIRNSWKPGVENFKKIRKKYLLYSDFE